MPKVGGKRYPYTAAGKRAAKKAHKGMMRPAKTKSSVGRPAKKAARPVKKARSRRY